MRAQYRHLNLNEIRYSHDMDVAKCIDLFVIGLRGIYSL